RAWPERRRPCHWRRAALVSAALIPLGRVQISWPPLGLRRLSSPQPREVADTMSRHQRPPTHAKSPTSKSPPRPPRAQPPTMPLLNPTAAGIAAPSDMPMVCGPPDRVSPAAAAAAADPANVRRFGANSCDLVAIADWLAECGVTTVAMESTGVYWIPLFEL